jgi:hypothetical protein
LPCAFTLDHYREILTELTRSHELVSFRDPSRKSERPAAIVRHDIDFSLDHALEVARIEHELGVAATYMIRLDAHYYNALSLPSLHTLRELIRLGHDLGLHYSAAFGDDLVDSVRRQLLILRTATNYDVVAGASHETSRTGVAAGIAHAAGLTVDAYDPAFTKAMKYLSDSAGRWRERCACEWIPKGEPLCILTHPLWWYETTPLERY